MNHADIRAAFAVLEEIEKLRARLRKIDVAIADGREMRVEVFSRSGQIWTVTALAEIGADRIDPVRDFLDVHRDRVVSAMKEKGRKLAQLGVAKPDDCL